MRRFTDQELDRIADGRCPNCGCTHRPPRFDKGPIRPSMIQVIDCNYCLSRTKMDVAIRLRGIEIERPGGLEDAET